ncbi:DUF302 domain-containing protein [Haloarcula sp. 1CSR25-25]|jgi:uncharacterized protein (DUF302 family)|uniref:DUF302 domain-containing protein n=1 Tax=Haloarcula sp. 1CSR25-25 TaxID=2862545 RepID=UPI002894FA06|nr:DUF302 domain-containing protein [Haloarcula sp. 1CSR25-25]MDT3437513.1 DUF302 domain-containing protein [Haloarcula sp. 1CSR25-25]
MTYTITTTIDAPFDDAVAAVMTALQDEGFGILCDIDVKTTLKEKLDVDVDQYRILGACNPPLAHEGLVEEPDLGALLPCNVVVYETDAGDVVVSAVDPQQLVAITENSELDGIATEVHERFERVLAVVTDQLTTESELQ